MVDDTLVLATCLVIDSYLILVEGDGVELAIGGDDQ